MAAHVGADHHEYLAHRSTDLLDFLPRMVHLQDEPIGDPVCVPLYYVSKLARDNGVIVCQVGEGADELFIGYPSWIEALKRQHWNDLPVPSTAKRLACGALRRARIRPRRCTTEWLRRGARNEPLFWGGAEAFTDAEKHRLLSPRLRASARRTDVLGCDSSRSGERFDQNAPGSRHLSTG